MPRHIWADHVGRGRNRFGPSLPRALAAVFAGVRQAGRAERNRRIRQAHLVHGYILNAIGAHLGLRCATLSRIVHRRMWQHET